MTNVLETQKRTHHDHQQYCFQPANDFALTFQILKKTQNTDFSF